MPPEFLVMNRMSSRSIQLSVLQVGAGITIGATIEALLPKPSEGASLSTQVFELMTQVGLNGVALFLFGDRVRGESFDPTFGIPFSQALMASQPKLKGRMQKLAALVEAQVVLTSQKIAPRVAGV